MPLARLACLTLLLPLLAGGCSLLGPPERDEAPTDRPLFEAETYRVNAQNYFDASQYSRARQQWMRALELDPGDWISRVGIASCDLYEAKQRQSRGDWRGARTRLERAEAELEELWDGTIEDRTRGAESDGKAQWKAALIMAELRRTQGEVDRLVIEALERKLETLSLGDERRPRFIDRILTLQERADERYARALELFGELARMENAAPDAVLNHAELLSLADQDARAEKEFRRYLTLAENSLQQFRIGQERLEIDYPAESARRIAAAAYAEKIESNIDKQVRVLDHLARSRYQQAQEPTLSREARDQHLGVAVDYLTRAIELDPERLVLYIRLAQCEGELGLIESALDRLEFYLDEVARRDLDYGEQVSEAYELREKLQARRDRREG